MAGVDTNIRRWSCVITQASGGAGRCGDVRYAVSGVMVVGGNGYLNMTNMEAFHPYGPEQHLESMAAIGDPCDITQVGDGDPKLFAWTEVWKTEEC